MCCYLIIIRFLSELANAKTGAGRAVGLVAFATLRLLGLRFYFHLTPGSAADAAVPGASGPPPRCHGALEFDSLSLVLNTPTNTDLVFMFLMMPTRLQFVDVAAR